MLNPITRAIADDPPMKFEDGGVIREGFNAELDELRLLSFSAKDWIANLQIKERERTGISSLKIGFNEEKQMSVRPESLAASKVVMDLKRVEEEKDDEDK